jgi:uncharacterized membrane protein
MYRSLLVLHFLGLALGVGTSFATLALGITARQLDEAERVKFLLRASVIGKNGSIGLALLLVTGVSMMLLRGTAATFSLGGPPLHAKLTLVAVLCGLIGYLQVLLRRARQAQGGPAMAILPRVGAVTLVTGVAIVVCAVLAFH